MHLQDCHQGYVYQHKTQNEGKAAKQPPIQQILQQVRDTKPKVFKGIVTGENHDGSFYQSSLGHSYLPSRNVQPVEKTGNDYHYT